MRIIRRVAPVIAAVSAALVLASCGSGPSQVSSAAIVGGKSIPLDSVQDEISWLITNVPQAKQYADDRKFKEISAAILSQRVIHELLQVAARQEGLRADPAKVSSIVESLGGPEEAARANGVLPARIKDLVTDQLLLEQLGRKYIDRLTLDVVAAGVGGERPGATSKQRALQLARAIAADPAQAGKLVRGASSQVIEGPLALREVLGSDPSLAGSALFGARPGTVVVFQPNPEQGSLWVVALVRDRKVGRAAGEPSASGDDPGVLVRVGSRMLAPLAQDLGVQVNPRYGAWDQAAMTIAPSERERSGFVFPVQQPRP